MSRATLEGDRATTERFVVATDDAEVFARLLRREVEERLRGMQPHRLRRTEVVRMAQDGDAGAFTIEQPARIALTQAWARFSSSESTSLVKACTSCSVTPWPVEPNSA